MSPLNYVATLSKQAMPSIHHRQNVTFDTSRKARNLGRAELKW